MQYLFIFRNVNLISVSRVSWLQLWSHLPSQLQNEPAMEALTYMHKEIESHGHPVQFPTAL